MQLLTFAAVTGNQYVLFAFDPEPANKSRQFSKDGSERIIIFFIGYFIIIWGSLPTLKTEDLFTIAHTSGQELEHPNHKY